MHATSGGRCILGDRTPQPYLPNMGLGNPPISDRSSRPSPATARPPHIRASSEHAPNDDMSPRRRCSSNVEPPPSKQQACHKRRHVASTMILQGCQTPSSCKGILAPVSCWLAILVPLPLPTPLTINSGQVGKKARVVSTDLMAL